MLSLVRVGNKVGGLAAQIVAVSDVRVQRSMIHSLCVVQFHHERRVFGAHHRFALSSYRRQASGGSLATFVDQLGGFPQRRSALVVLEEVEELHRVVSASTVDTLTAHFGFSGLCNLCHLLAASGFLLDERLLHTAADLLSSRFKKDTGFNQEDADGAAVLALAACESGHEKRLGAELVNSLRAGTDMLSGSGAAALALAAAASGQADSVFMDALLERCSDCELDLTSKELGDVRLAALLAGKHVVDRLSLHAATFLRTLCHDARLDDPRGEMPPGKMDKVLTPFEVELSEVLTLCEIPHTRGMLICGMFFPLTNHSQQRVFCAEDLQCCAVHKNDAKRPRTWQRWRYRVAKAAGWHVFTFSEEEWNLMTDSEERAAHIRKVVRGKEGL